jgi:hypothetical protein
MPLEELPLFAVETKNREAFHYGRGCREKNSHILGLALKSVTP